MDNVVIFKTKMRKYGDVKSYINKPVVDRMTGYIDINKGIGEINNESKVIGVVMDAIELDDCFEVTLALWKEKLNFRRELYEDSLVSMSII
jgi:hypothetical protein